MLSNVRTFGVLVSFLLLSLLLPVCSQKIEATQQTVTPQATPVQNAPAQSAPAQNTPVQNTSAQGKPAATQDLLIGGGDLLEVTVEGASDYDKEVRVNHDGEIYLPLIGAVKAAGLSDRKSTRLNSSHVKISYAVFCLKKKT